MLFWAFWIVPQTLTLFRLGVGLVLCLNLSISTKKFLFFFAILSDGLDGFLARRWKVCSALGACLDPVADRVLFYALAWSFSSSVPGKLHHHLLLIPLRDLALLLYWLCWLALPARERQTSALRQSMISGKLLTAFQALLMFALFYGVPIGLEWFFVHSFLIAVTAFELGSLFS
ncbi:CDP-alcohol phosphatidyltransferase family protein [Candidatus Similichlamydia laticola]|uniref:CDP-diacylglycerol--glycerol-3-phosphate 3-phosphatidyltransferase n=1 Tax=Candidatus Similichlamydia laticola TaxID=2170265 RepID=A0A369KE55_9BACT|nr:CDP-alcohol phosphatidyltransferase family protein [Candidatus Similichlamydia laticola]RDB31740.1 CDP-diacylglycerol--glycerol-3-phosphate 3-phosphatidyltransferase [Candidatus Similichlamydia laticola]